MKGHDPLEKPVKIGDAQAMTTGDAHNCWTIRLATLEHLEALVILEECCFSVPWSRKNFEAELTGNQFSRLLMINHPDRGHEDHAIGYICVWMVFEELRVLNLAIHPEFRRRGLASQLVDKAIRLGTEEGCSRGMLEVRASNTAARKLYEHFNFRQYAIRKSYYTNPTEDAILMTLEPLGRHLQSGGWNASEKVVDNESFTQVYPETSERSVPYGDR